jgi:hypothetical protein
VTQEERDKLQRENARLARENAELQQQLQTAQQEIQTSKVQIAKENVEANKNAFAIVGEVQAKSNGGTGNGTPRKNDLSEQEESEKQKKLKSIDDWNRDHVEKIKNTTDTMTEKGNVFKTFPLPLKKSLGQVLKVELGDKKWTAEELKIVLGKVNALGDPIEGSVFGYRKSLKGTCGEIVKKVKAKINGESSVNGSES